MSSTVLETLILPAGSVGPKSEAAITFVRRTGRRAAIGTLAQLGGVVAGELGTQILPDPRQEPSDAPPPTHRRRRTAAYVSPGEHPAT